MLLVGMVEDCETAPESFPDLPPSRLCDVCISPPYTAAGLRTLLMGLYEAQRGEPAPPPRTAAADPEGDDDDE